MLIKTVRSDVMGAAECNPNLLHRWEHLYKAALFEVEPAAMPRRIETAKHAILDRLEDVNCSKSKQTFDAGELLALRRAHHTLRALEDLYGIQNSDRMIA